MLAEVELEILRFCCRNTLDAYQLVSKGKQLLVEKGNSLLALRTIQHVLVVSFPLYCLLISLILYLPASLKMKLSRRN